MTASASASASAKRRQDVMHAVDALYRVIADARVTQTRLFIAGREKARAELEHVVASAEARIKVLTAELVGDSSSGISSEEVRASLADMVAAARGVAPNRSKTQ